MKYKKCSKCKKYKLLNKFYNYKRAKDGLNYICKKCDNTNTLNWQKNNPEKLDKIQKNTVKNHPWYKTFDHIQNRCNSSKHLAYPWYGGRGIRNCLTMDNLKFLWFRDKAYFMKNPSIDRIDPDGNYTLKNCRYIELSKNIHRKRPRIKLIKRKGI